MRSSCSCAGEIGERLALPTAFGEPLVNDDGLIGSDIPDWLTSWLLSPDTDRPTMMGSVPIVGSTSGFVIDRLWHVD